MKYLLLCLALIVLDSVSVFAQLKYSKTITAPDGKEVLVFRDEFGVPHVKAQNETGVFFGQGYCNAEDRLWQMETFRRTAEGRLAEINGNSSVPQDQYMRRNFATLAERVQAFASLPAHVQNAFTSYAAGVNAYVAYLQTHPQFIPREIAAMMQAGVQPEAWTVYNSMAVAQFLMWRFGQIGGSELTNFNYVKKYGLDSLNRLLPLNDTLCFSTIPDSEIGAAGGGEGMKGNKVQGGSLLTNLHLTINPALIEELETSTKEVNKHLLEIGMPKSLGSFAVLSSGLRSAAGDVMLLGAPQMDAPSKTTTCIVNEMELSCPEYHVGGIGIAGFPYIIIGHNENIAWSFTTGYSDNTDMFADSLSNDSTKHWYNGKWNDITFISDTIKILNAPDRIVKHGMTVHGPIQVTDYANHYVYAMQCTFRQGNTGRDWDMTSFLDAIGKAATMADFEQAAAQVAMSFNAFVITKDQQLKYFHLGKYIDRTNDPVDPRLPRLGDGTQEWKGYMNFTALPKLANPKQGYLINWNNKPVKWWGNGDVGWIHDDGTQKDAVAMNGVVTTKTTLSYSDLKAIPKSVNAVLPVPFSHYDRGTYQQAVEFTKDGTIIDENIFRPGQSGFISTANVRDPHYSDLWDIYNKWEFKDQRFGEFETVGVDEDANQMQNTAIVAYPNPALQSTSLRITTSPGTQVNVELYSIFGTKVRTLSALADASGVAYLFWDGKTGDNSLCAVGRYIGQVQIGEQRHSCSIVLLR